MPTREQNTERMRPVDRRTLRRKDYSAAVEMYRAGASIGQVAEAHGVRRQAMYDILLRRGVEMRPQLRYGADNHFFRGGGRLSGRANDRLEKAVLRGRIKRPDQCEQCGASPRFKDGRSGIQAHHPDYNKPLEVMWLCQPCHHKWHQQHRPIAVGEMA